MYRNPDVRNILFRTLRQAADMSLKDVAEAFSTNGDSITVSQLSDFERGKPVLGTWQQQKIARILMERLQNEQV